VGVCPSAALATIIDSRLERDSGNRASPTRGGAA
jgi:hypothetical protein